MAKAPSSVSNLNSALRLLASGPWHLKQRSDKIGRTWKLYVTVSGSEVFSGLQQANNRMIAAVTKLRHQFMFKIKKSVKRIKGVLSGDLPHPVSKLKLVASRSPHYDQSWDSNSNFPSTLAFCPEYMERQPPPTFAPMLWCLFRKHFLNHLEARQIHRLQFVIGPSLWW